MKFFALLFAFALTCFYSCTKSNNQQIADGTYSGISLFTAPLETPYDSVSTPVTLTISGNKFSGSSDTTRSELSPAIGFGTYAAGSGSIVFTQDSAVYSMGQTRSVLDGKYQLIKTGDSLVFAVIPPAGLTGAGTIYYRLRKN